MQLTLGYGDSTDGTPAALHDECVSRFDANLVDVSHGGVYFGSIVHPVRFKQLAGIANKLYAVIPKGADYVLHVESDLIWQAEVLMSLLNGVEALRSIDSISSAHTLLAPMIIDAEGRFYDTWAFRLYGTRFFHQKPYHSALEEGTRYYDMDSVGSCFIMNADLASKVFWPDRDVVVGMCNQVNLMHGRIYLDSKLEVYHP